jgi:hypothetical protein
MTIDEEQGRNQLADLVYSLLDKSTTVRRMSIDSGYGKDGLPFVVMKTSIVKKKEKETSDDQD